MKKNKVLIFVLLFIIVLFSIYKNLDLSLNPQIEARKIENVPLQGTWIANKYVFLGNAELSDKDAKNLLGKKAEFNSMEVHFDNEVCKNPDFKVKMVDSKDYFWNNFSVKPSNLGINEEKIKIITVTSGENFFDEYIQINNNYIMKNHDGIMMFFKKYGVNINDSSFDEKLIKSNNKIERSKLQKEITSKSGMLLGLKSKDNKNGGYTYRTLWISSNYNKLDPSMEMENLFVPRKNGFWKIGVDKINSNGVKRDSLWGIPLNKNNLKDKITTKDSSELLINNSIMFVGNEYISLDNEDLYKNDEKNKFNYFSVLPIDNISGDKIKFSKILGNNNEDILTKSASLHLKRLNSNQNIDKEELETNWTIIRRNGRWVLRGKIDSNSFDILFDTPKVLTTYDDLYVAFHTIKNKIPDLVDAYTSPNKDFIVALTKTNLLVLPINNKVIGDVKLNIELKQEEIPVMVQWATGSYVDEWKKLFYKQNFGFQEGALDPGVN